MKPILFNTAMVRAILDGEKTCTRRIIKRTPSNDTPSGFGFWREFNETDKKWYIKDYTHGCVWWEENEYIRKFSKFHVGDILYVRETWANTWTPDGEVGFVYKADGEPKNFPYWGNAKRGKHEVWMPSIHMPKEAARVFLKVISVRAERLKDIDEEQAKKEGARKQSWYQPFGTKIEDEQKYVGSLVNHKINYKTGFADIWDRTVKEEKYSWEGNPWVWVIEFERVEKVEK
ncbi:hypothetical protein P5F08_03680 [Clostridium perfringens]|nr:hypothetical protein [Clostridium perfringens]